MYVQYCTSKRPKMFVHIKIYNGKLNKNCLTTRVRLYENLKPKLSMLPLPDPDSLDEELKRVHLQCYVLLCFIFQ